ncbi:RNA methyltransferase PUA domain-containing protein [Streptomyces sp. M19]
MTGSLAGAAEGARLTLDGPEGRHAVSVRRLRVGEEVVLTDGRAPGRRARSRRSRARTGWRSPSRGCAPRSRRVRGSPSSRRCRRATGARWRWRP